MNRNFHDQENGLCYPKKVENIRFWDEMQLSWDEIQCLDRSYSIQLRLEGGDPVS